MKGLRLHRRLAFQLAGTVALLAGSVFAATGWLLIRDQRASLTREFTLRMLSDTRTLAVAASSALLRQDPELELHPMVTRALDEVDDLVDLVVIDAEGRYQGHRDLARIGQPAEPIPPGAQPLLEVGPARVYQDDHNLYLERPIEHLDRRVGTLRATVGRERIEAAVTASTRSLLLVGGGGTLAGLLLVLVLVTTRLRPLEPLREGVQRIGAGQLDTRVTVHDRSEFGLLADHINRMAEGLEHAQEERIRQERLDHELQIAQQIQSTLLPRRMPQVEGIEIATHYSPALEVGGDLFDVFSGAEGRVVIVVADVSGKGVPGMVVMAMTRVIVRELAARHVSPAEILRRANAALVDLTPRSMFVTLLLGSYDTVSGRIVYASAGHCPPVGFAPGRTNELPAGGKPLGIFPPAVFDPGIHEYATALSPGAGILLYTDGLAECENEAGQQLGEDAVRAALERAPLGCAEDAVQTMLALVRKHRGRREPNDDLTLLVLRRSTGVLEEVLA